MGHAVQCVKERAQSLRRFCFQSEYGGVEDVRMRRQLIWTPDILLFESSSASFDPTYPSNIVVGKDGGCSFVPPGIFKSTCSIDMTWNEPRHLAAADATPSVCLAVMQLPRSAFKATGVGERETYRQSV